MPVRLSWQEREAKREAEAKEKKEQEKKKSGLTVFVSQIHPKVEEMDLFEFFSHVGRVQDIRLIKDARTRRSKGLCYVEFDSEDCVLRAIALSGQALGGYPITIEAIKQKVEEEEVELPPSTAFQILVSNLAVEVGVADLEGIFAAFGEVSEVLVRKDAAGASMGKGSVTYVNEADGRQALENLNGLEIISQAVSTLLCVCVGVGVCEGVSVPSVCTSGLSTLPSPPLSLREWRMA